MYKNAFDCAAKTAKAEGVGALWKGIEPALWRQASYGSLRYGLYSPIKDALAPGVEKKDMPLGKKILAGGLSGTLAQGIANPCDVVKVRMIGAGMGGGGGPGYRWFLGAFVDIAQKEGIRGLYSGLGANVGRASTLAAAEMASYDQIKPIMKGRFKLEEGLFLHALTATQAGFIAAFVANPFDVVKSRVMNASGGYTGMMDCFAKTIKNEGVASLWKGFIPAWARVGPRVVIAFVTMEQLRMRFG